MKYALINPASEQTYIAGFVQEADGSTSQVIETYVGSAVVAQVADSVFDVASPLYWLACPDDAVAYESYYSAAGTFEVVEHAISNDMSGQVAAVVDGAQEF